MKSSFPLDLRILDDITQKLQTPDESKKQVSIQYNYRILSSPSFYVFYKHSEFHSIFHNTIVPCGPLEVGDNHDFQMDPLPRGGIPLHTKPLAQSPHFQPNDKTITDWVIE